MSNRLIIAALVLIGVAVLGWTYYTTLPEPVVEAAEVATDVATSENAEMSEDMIAADLATSVMAIEVAGEANGVIRIELFDTVAPGHVARIKQLIVEGAYDGVVFHRVIDGFMAQTGDVQYGRSDGDTSRAGMGGSDEPDLEAEFSQIPFERGIVGMARSQNPNSANSQFFIMFAPAPHLNGAYTVVGEVISGFEVLDAIKKGRGQNGAVIGAPDVMASVTIEE